MDKSILFNKLRILSEQAEFVLLSTINEDDFPETRAMLNLRNKEMFPNLQVYFADDFICYFSSNTASQKLNQILYSDKASVYYVNPKTFEGLLLKGKLEIIKDKALKNDFWQDNWTMYYKGGIDDPDYSLLKFTPAEYKYYNGDFKVSSGAF
ncbi:MAG: pyridoxamine 5'-phosphate oxidase family protein [Endomicrobium sp.]|jgi:general stress protein 26|nr:pyridoxamine 5'-phosphate oxidase family protein [Endomicrobium sp.]